MPRPLNVATPPVAVAVRVVLLVPTTFPDDNVAVTTFVADETLLLPASRSSSTGCVVKASLYTAPLASVVAREMVTPAVVPRAAHARATEAPST